MDVKHVSLYVDDRPGEGVFRVHRDVYTDEALFELEMKHVFERTWNFVAIESDLKKPGDYVTVQRVLGHKSLNTTTSTYTGMETRAAGRHFVEVVRRRQSGVRA